MGILPTACRGRSGDSNGDGLITVNEAYDEYVSKIVPAATGQRRRPYKEGAAESPIILERVERHAVSKLIRRR